MSAYDFFQAHVQETQIQEDKDAEIDDPPATVEHEPELTDTLLSNATKVIRSNKLPPGDIRRFMSKRSTRMVNLAHLDYQVSYHKASSGQSLSLIDMGANGGVVGTDVCIIFETGIMVDIRGIDNHHCTNIDIRRWSG